MALAGSAGHRSAGITQRSLKAEVRWTRPHPNSRSPTRPQGTGLPGLARVAPVASLPQSEGSRTLAAADALFVWTDGVSSDPPRRGT
jgi:hypothetical protein